MDRGHNSAYNVGFRLVCNADDSVKGTVTTREAANAGANKATGKGKALIIFYSWGGNTLGVAREIARQTGFDRLSLNLLPHIPQTTTPF